MGMPVPLAMRGSIGAHLSYHGQPGGYPAGYPGGGGSVSNHNSDDRLDRTDRASSVSAAGTGSGSGEHPLRTASSSEGAQFVSALADRGPFPSPAAAAWGMAPSPKGDGATAGSSTGDNGESSQRGGRGFSGLSAGRLSSNGDLADAAVAAAEVSGVDGAGGGGGGEAGALAAAENGGGRLSYRGGAPTAASRR